MQEKTSPVLIIDVKDNKSADKIIQELTKSFGLKKFLLGARVGWWVNVVKSFVINKKEA